MTKILGLVISSKNPEKTYMSNSNNRSDEPNKVAQLELHRDSLKHEFLVVFGVV